MKSLLSLYPISAKVSVAKSYESDVCVICVGVVPRKAAQTRLATHTRFFPDVIYSSLNEMKH